MAQPATADYNNALYTAAISRLNTVFVSYRASGSRGNVTATFGTPVINTTVFDGANNTYYQNGTAGTTAASTGNFGYTNYEIGGSFGEESLVPYDGLIGEVIHYTTALTTAQRQNVEGYLAWKWGLVSSLPANHPFKQWPPAP